MYSDGDTPKGWVAPFGHPRIKACSRLPVAFRSVPRPSSPPGAKASTECPSLARDRETHLSMRPSPCTETILSDQHLMINDQQTLADPPNIKHQAPTPRTDPRWIASSLSTQQSPLNTLPRQRDIHSQQGTDHPVRLAAAARPETHQNLIHPDKEHAPSIHIKGDNNGITPNPEHPVPDPSQSRSACFSAIQPIPPSTPKS